MTLRALLPSCLITVSLASATYAQQAADDVAPEDATRTAAAFAGLSDSAQTALDSKLAGEPTTAQDWMVAAANPLAVDAGADVLRAGGTAADAMVAVQAVLGLVEPQSSGLGGGAFLVWYDATSGELTTLDGRETAPLAATPTMFQDENGERLSFFDAVVGGLSVGTPGTPKLMEDAHRRWGQSNWADLLTPAIDLAEAGFIVSPRLADAIGNDSERLQRFPATADYFFPDGAALAAGDKRTNAAYADTLRQMAQRGSVAFYSGAIAEDIIATVRNAEGNPGRLSTIDLALYDVVERAPVCVPYRTYDVCGMGPPSSGALTVGQILGIVNNFDISDPTDANTWRLIGDASRLAFADRGRYMADHDYVPMPTEGLIDPVYLKERADLIEGDRTDGFVALPEVGPGNPEWDHAQLWGDDVSIEFPSTSHISIVDSYGNALSMTTTIENGFGSRLFVRGFLLNNELTDFSFATHDNGAPIANRIEPGKRPRSSMAPTIVMQDGSPALVIGSPGGSRIIGYVAKTIIAYVDWGMDIQQAIGMPHLVNRFGTYDIEEGTDVVTFEAPLTELGYEVGLRGLNSGLHAISVGDTLQGGADPRREGIALGE